MTESAETTSSSNVFCGGSGARAGSCAARSSACEAAALVSVVADPAAGVGGEGEFDVAGGGVGPLLLGQLRSSVGGASCRCVPAGADFVSRAALRAGASGRLAAAAGAAGFDVATRGAHVAAGASPINASGF